MTITTTNRRIRISTGGGARVVRIGSPTARTIERERVRSDVVVRAPKTDVRVEANTAQRVETGGKQGLPGRDGAAADAVVRVAAGPIGGHRVVRSAGGLLAGYVDNRDPVHGDDTLGLTVGAAADGALLTIQSSGPITHAGWDWAPLLPVFAGLDGTLTQIAPDPDEGAAFAQIVGHAESPTSIFVNPQPPIYF